MILPDPILVPFSEITGGELDEAASDCYTVPFQAWIDGAQRTVTAVLNRTVVYDCPELDDRFVARFDKVLVDPEAIQIHRSRRRSLAYNRTMSILAVKPCAGCRTDFHPLQSAHRYCSGKCQEKAREDRRASRQYCVKCKKKKSDIDSGSYCRDCRSEYNRTYHIRHRDEPGGIMTTATE